jgi:hypothetical protein
MTLSFALVPFIRVSPKLRLWHPPLPYAAATVMDLKTHSSSPFNDDVMRCNVIPVHSRELERRVRVHEELLRRSIHGAKRLDVNLSNLRNSVLAGEWSQVAESLLMLERTLQHQPWLHLATLLRKHLVGMDEPSTETRVLVITLMIPFLVEAVTVPNIRALHGAEQGGQPLRWTDTNILTPSPVGKAQQFVEWMATCRGAGGKSDNGVLHLDTATAQTVAGFVRKQLSRSTTALLRTHHHLPGDIDSDGSNVFSRWGTSGLVFQLSGLCLSF